MNVKLSFKESSAAVRTAEWTFPQLTAMNIPAVCQNRSNPSALFT